MTDQEPQWSSSWEGISVQRRMTYKVKMIAAAIVALMAGPNGAGMAMSPIDPRRLRDRQRAADLEASVSRQVSKDD